jgi:hypothetical protein
MNQPVITNEVIGENDFIYYRSQFLTGIGNNHDGINFEISICIQGIFQLLIAILH